MAVKRKRERESEREREIDRERTQTKRRPVWPWTRAHTQTMTVMKTFEFIQYHHMMFWLLGFQRCLNVTNAKAKQEKLPVDL